MRYIEYRKIKHGSVGTVTTVSLAVAAAGGDPLSASHTRRSSPDEIAM
jgi:hypothetical protein